MLLQRYQETLSKAVSSSAGMLCVDGSDFAKKGSDSVGVLRQYCGRLGKTENCQAGVFLSYASELGYGIVARKLYADTFSRFTLHHKFEAAFCNPNKGNEKGSVENKVGYKRRNLFVPVPTIVDLEQFNRELLIRCDENMKHEHYRKKELICDLHKEDLKSMLPLPQERFKVTRLVKGKTDNYSFVSFENNKYSTSPEYHRCEVWYAFCYCRLL